LVHPARLVLLVVLGRQVRLERKEKQVHRVLQEMLVRLVPQVHLDMMELQVPLGHLVLEDLLEVWVLLVKEVHRVPLD
jgi:hypothetical protein